MADNKISTLLAMSIISSTAILSAPTPSYATAKIISSETASQRTSARRMKHQLAPIPMLQKPGSFSALLEESRRLASQATTKDEIAEYAKNHCLNEGTLQKTRDYVYLKLNKEYLTEIFEKIKEENPGVRMPSFRGRIGPHISIIRHDEWKETPLETISELGAKYIFTPLRVDVIQMENKKLWVLVVEPSPEILAIRDRYAVGSKPYGHEFHITVAQLPNPSNEA